ncbi:hypothetical protein [Streptomyces sp. NPDC029526]
MELLGRGRDAAGAKLSADPYLTPAETVRLRRRAVDRSGASGHGH